jgi:hypothetical protein
MNAATKKKRFSPLHMALRAAGSEIEVIRRSPVHGSNSLMLHGEMCL